LFIVAFQRLDALRGSEDAEECQGLGVWLAARLAEAWAGLLEARRMAVSPVWPGMAVEEVWRAG
jgi:hypothetical protein